MASAPANAASGNDQFAVWENPNTNTMLAPTEAPELTPMMLGSASGLANTPCMIAPATARAAPTNAASAARGKRIDHNTASTRDRSGSPAWAMPANSDLITSEGDVENWPTEADTTRARTSATVRTAPVMTALRRCGIGVDRFGQRHEVGRRARPIGQELGIRGGDDALVRPGGGLADPRTAEQSIDAAG